MIEELLEFIVNSADWSKLLDGMLLGVGGAMVYLGVIVSGSLIRTLSLLGGGGLLFAGKFFMMRRRYNQGAIADIVNVTLNTTRGGKLSIDTIVADHLLSDVWPNAYHVMKLKRVAKKCTVASPVVMFENGKSSSHIDEYRATYDPLVSMVAERCTNNNSIDFALGRKMTEHRFVLALTFEPKTPGRSQHFRVMMLAEEELMMMAAELKFQDAGIVPRILETAREREVARLHTLYNVAALYQDHPERFGIINVWRPVEEPICVA